MQSANSIMLKCSPRSLAMFILGSGTFLLGLTATAQDNSPYSRYGLGDMVPQTNITTRGMGSISAGYTDVLSINFNNPASYSQFQALKDARSSKLVSGRALLEVGLNFDNRTLIAPNTANRFTSADAYFSYLQVGVPLRKNWGLSFGLRPISRISYTVNRKEALVGENLLTQFKGSGGSYLPTIGTGFGFNLSSHDDAKATTTHFLSLGANGGYMFGSRENSTRRTFLNDSTPFYSSDYQTTSSFGDLFFNSGLQYSIDHLDKVEKTVRSIRFGLSGNIRHDLKGSQDLLRQTFSFGTAGEELQIDSVYQQTGVKGSVVYPASYKAGVVIQKTFIEDSHGWIFGADFTQNKWSQYRFFGQKDSVQDSWQVNVGGQISPKPQKAFFSRVAYRFGFYAGQDYVRVTDKLPVFGVTAGLGLPINTRWTAQARNQYSMLNLSFEYGKRGNDNNLLKENIFRISAGFSLSDLWFGKKKYE